MKEGYWDRNIKEALKIRKDHICPFQLFAQSYGYDLKYDTLIFPRNAPEFQRVENNYYGLPYGGWIRKWISFYNLPKNVLIDYVATRTKSYTDKVMLVKSCHYIVDGFLVNWELIKKPWPNGSYCKVFFEIHTLKGPCMIPKSE